MPGLSLLQEWVDMPLCTVYRQKSHHIFKWVIELSPPQLKAYARAQGKLGPWDGSDRGYTWTGLTSVDLFMPLASFLLMISTLGLMIRFTPHLLKSLREEANQQTRPVTGVFWALAILAFIYNCTLPVDILLLTETCPVFHTVCTLKVAVILLSAAVGLGWMLLTYCVATALLPHLIKCFLRFLYSLAFFNVSLSICNLAGTIIPTFILATVYPIEVLSTAALMCAVIFCFASIFAVLFAYKKTVNISECQRAISSLCNVILLSLFLMSVVLVGILYLKTIRPSNDLLSIMLSFLPSALLTAVGYVKGKKLFKKNQPHQKSTMDQQSHNGDTELLTLAEEGSQAPADEEQDQPSVKDEWEEHKKKAYNSHIVCKYVYCHFVTYPLDYIVRIYTLPMYLNVCCWTAHSVLCYTVHSVLCSCNNIQCSAQHLWSYS